MNSRASARFWERFDRLPPTIQQLARKNFELWRHDSRHPSLRFKEVKARLWSARIGGGYRALAAFDGTTYVWFWIGKHDEYEVLLRS